MAQISFVFFFGGGGLKPQRLARVFGEPTPSSAEFIFPALKKNPKVFSALNGDFSS